MAKAGDEYLVGKVPKGKTNPTQARQYIRESRKVINLRQKTINDKVQDWYTFSITPQSEEDIKNMIIKELAERKPGKYVCLSYVCKYSKLSEEFIEEIIELTKVKIRKEFYDKEKHERTIDYVYTSRIDWKNICQFQKLSEKFIERHKNDVLWNFIYQFQDLSEEFKKEHKHDREEASLIEDSDEESENTH